MSDKLQILPLKPCPFCGDAQVLEFDPDPRFEIACAACGGSVRGESIRHVRERWNKRPASSPGLSDEAVLRVYIKGIRAARAEVAGHRLEPFKYIDRITATANALLSRIDSAPAQFRAMDGTAPPPLNQYGGTELYREGEQVTFTSEGIDSVQAAEPETLVDENDMPLNDPFAAQGEADE